MQLEEWSEHVLSLVRQMRGGRDNDARFGTRMRGEGQFAELIRQRFAIACRRLGYLRTRNITLDCSLFEAPRAASPQGELFGSR